MLEPALAAKQLEEIADGTLDGGFLAWRDPDDPAFKAVHPFDCKLKLAMPRMGDADGGPPVPPERLADLKNEPCIWFKRRLRPLTTTS